MKELEQRLRAGYRIIIRKRHHVDTSGLVVELFDENEAIACVTYPDGLAGIISEMAEAFQQRVVRREAKPSEPCTRHESDGSSLHITEEGQSAAVMQFTTCKHCAVLFRKP